MSRFNLGQTCPGHKGKCEEDTMKPIHILEHAIESKSS